MYYNLNSILKKQCDYNIIFGERSNGKTFALLTYILKRYVKSNGVEKGALIRRWKEDVKGARARAMFNGVESEGEVERITKGKWTKVVFFNGSFYLGKWDYKIQRYVTEEEPFCYLFALSDMEHDKSTSYPQVTTVVFDEFLTRKYYLNDEFILFMNVLSTIIRDRKNVKIFMLGNTVNKFCPYFQEMGLKHISKQKQGTIDIYRYGQNENECLKVAVEYCSTSNSKKESNKYFAFDSPSLKMITKGSWELAIYPHLQLKYDKKDIVFTFFIEFENILQCDIIVNNSSDFLYIHEKTTPIKDRDKDLIYTLKPSEKNNYRRNLLKPSTRGENKIASYFKLDKVFYQNNEVGEVVKNYLIESNRSFYV